ncbi:MAG: DUF3443 family protein [Pararobbsia sp.]
MRGFKFWVVVGACAWLAACGGGGGSSSDGGPTASNTPAAPAAPPANPSLLGSTSLNQIIAAPGANAVAIAVAAAPAASDVVVANVPLVSVRLCPPGSTANCVTIPNIQVDTGSSGLRVLASALQAATPNWAALFPQASAPAPATGNLGECMVFATASRSARSARPT